MKPGVEEVRICQKGKMKERDCGSTPHGGRKRKTSKKVAWEHIT